MSADIGWRRMREERLRLELSDRLARRAEAKRALESSTRTEKTAVILGLALLAVGALLGVKSLTRGD